MMPGMDGIEAVRIIREEIGSEYAKNIPIIALTANAIVGREEMFLNKGFQAFISKPIDLARLDIVLRQWVRNKKAEKMLPNHTINIEVKRGTERERADIPGLDVNKVVAHFDFNEEVYLGILESYVKNTQPLLDIIKKVNSDNLEAYAVTIHGIKGSSRGIFAEKIGNEAEALEKAATAGDYEFILNNNQRFLDMLLQLFMDIEDALAKSRKRSKPIQDKIDDALLLNLLSTCNSFDIDEIDKVMAAIESCDYTSDGGLAVWLRENLDKGKIKSVKEKLTALINNTEV